MHSPRNTRGMLGLLFAFALAGSLAFAMHTSDSTDQLSKERFLKSNTLIGNTVIDNSGRELGTVKDFLIDQQSGKISFIIVS